MNKQKAIEKKEMRRTYGGQDDIGAGDKSNTFSMLAKHKLEENCIFHSDRAVRCDKKLPNILPKGYPIHSV